MKYLINILFGIAILILFYLHFSKPSKIVFVNEGIVSEKYQGMIEARRNIQQKSKSIQTNIDTLVSELQQAIAIYEKNRTHLSENERKLNEQLLSSKQQQLAQYQDATQKKIAEEQKKTLEEVAKKMNLFMNKYAKDHNYQFVLGSSILYGSSDMDITENVIEGLNQEYSKQ
jgi:outer membrane protein